jgi:hypothetical protein
MEFVNIAISARATGSTHDLRKDKIGMGIGGLGLNLGTAVLMTYLTCFYTGNMVIPSVSVSVILFLSRIVDALTDLWMGTLIDRCRSGYGKARPWRLWMAAPEVISTSAVYFVSALNENGRTIHAENQGGAPGDRGSIALNRLRIGSHLHLVQSLRSGVNCPILSSGS